MKPMPLLHRPALARLAAAARTTDIAWTLSGSLGLYLQGMPLSPRDIDVETDAAGAAFFARHFAAETTRPIAYGEEGIMRSTFGVVTLEGTAVDIVGELEVRIGEPAAWVRSGHHLRTTWVERDGLRLPVLAADEEHAWTVRIGRNERAAAIAEWLSTRRRII